MASPTRRLPSGTVLDGDAEQLAGGHVEGIMDAVIIRLTVAGLLGGGGADRVVRVDTF